MKKPKTQGQSQCHGKSMPEPGLKSRFCLLPQPSALLLLHGNERQDFSPFAKGTTPSGFLTGPSVSAGDESWGRGSGSRAEDGGGCWSWAGSSQVTGLASPAILLRKASVLLFWATLLRSWEGPNCPGMWHFSVASGWISFLSMESYEV